MKPIFNSLGSNYKLGFAIFALRQMVGSKKEALATLKNELEHKFGGEAKLLYKGRDAIEFALKAYGMGSGDSVLTQALACCAVEEAIIRTGAKPIFADVEINNVNLSTRTLEAAFKQAPNPKAVIVQNIFGIPAEIEKIKKWCDEHKLLLIEDLAQSVGAISNEGKPLGSYGDIVVLSFGRDKILDAVSGGAVIFRGERPRRTLLPEAHINQMIVARDMFYPALTWKIRKTHRFLLGKVILRLSKMVGLDASATSSPNKTFAPMPSAYASLVLAQSKVLTEQLEHRRRIAGIYLRELSNGRDAICDKDLVARGANLRFALRIKSPDEIINLMKQKNIYISDRWYRAPVDCGSLSFASSYQQGSCPNAERMAKEIINLPTHINMTPEDALRVVKDIKSYLQ